MQMPQWREVSDSSRVWIYASDRKLTDAEVQLAEEGLKQFIDRWSAHGSKMKAEAHVLNHVFLVIAADESQTKASGCSIDDSVHFVQELGKAMGVDFFNRMITHYEKDGELNLVKLHEFWAMRKAGVVSGDTIVYNNLITNLGEFKTSWRTSFEKSWHQQMWN